MIETLKKYKKTTILSLVISIFTILTFCVAFGDWRWTEKAEHTKVQHGLVGLYELEIMRLCFKKENGDASPLDITTLEMLQSRLDDLKR